MDNQCAVCSKTHPQLLMLICSHDPCIQCASTHYTKEMKRQSDFQLCKSLSDIYPCQICFQITKLSQQTVEEIKAHAKQRKISQNLQKNRKRCRSNSNKADLISSRKPSETKSKPLLQKNVGSAKQYSTSSSRNFQLLKIAKTQSLKPEQFYQVGRKKSVQKVEHTVFKQKFSPYLQQSSQFCDKHEDQIKTYYCFTCQQAICAECAIHGFHVGHDVSAIRRVGSKLKAIYNQFLLDVQKSTTILSGVTKELSTLMQIFRDWNNRQRKILKERFAELRRFLTDKEDKLLEEIDKIQSKGLDKIAEEKKQYERYIVELKEKKKKIKQTTKKQPHSWNFNYLQGEKKTIGLILNGLKSVNLKKDKSELEYVKCDIVEEAIDAIEELVPSFRLSFKSKEMEGTASFKHLSY